MGKFAIELYFSGDDLKMLENQLENVDTTDAKWWKYFSEGDLKMLKNQRGYVGNI